MTASGQPRAASATVAVRVPVAPKVAFDLFVREVDLWWRRGPKYRHGTGPHARIAIEARLGGRVHETWTDGETERAFELGRIFDWDPPSRFAFTWRNATFAPLERTEVTVTFEATRSGTLVTVRHVGLEDLRPDHPARHGLANPEFAAEFARWWGDQMSALRERASES